MKLALRITVTTLVAALLAVPAATAEPGGGHGKGAGGGKPAWAGGAKGAEKSKAAKEDRGKKTEQAGKSGQAKTKKAKGPKKHSAEACAAVSSLTEAIGGLFGADAGCEAEQQVADPAALPDLEGLGPGQYCHVLEAWVAANGGNFSTTFGTEGSGYANDHGKCASRRAHGEDLLAVAQASLPAQPAAEGEQAAQALELPALEGLGPGQYCHTLEAWMAANGGNFSTTFGTEGSGYANDHGKCASRRAHGEDLAPAALQSVCDAAKTAAETSGAELPEECREQEQQQSESPASTVEQQATGDLATLLRLLSF